MDIVVTKEFNFTPYLLKFLTGSMIKKDREAVIPSVTRNLVFGIASPAGLAMTMLFVFNT